jgi:hypothetical protein
MHDIKKNEFFTKLHTIVIKTTVLPFSALTNLFHQRFSKHRFLESTLELLQQFYISMEYHITKFNVFADDLNQFCVRCARCRRRVLTIADIGTILIYAPTAMLIHSRFIHSHGNDADDDSDGSKTDVFILHCPCCSALKRLTISRYLRLSILLIILMSAFTTTSCALRNIVVNTGS